MLLFHIIIALSSLLATGLALIFPSRLKLQIGYGLVALTLFTGFFLTLSKPAHLTQTCITGLVYLGVVSWGLVSARKKLSTIIVK